MIQDLLVKRIKEKNIILSASLAMYVESFRHGIYPHGGAGIGLDRLLFLYLGKCLSEFHYLLLFHV